MKGEGRGERWREFTGGGVEPPVTLVKVKGLAIRRTRKNQNQAGGKGKQERQAWRDLNPHKRTLKARTLDHYATDLKDKPEWS